MITLGSNETWTETEGLSQTANGRTTTGTQTDGGTWTSFGMSVTFTSATDGSLAYAGTYSDNTLTLDNGDRTAQVFTRQ